MSRTRDLDRFYSLLGDLEETVGGKRLLRNSHGRLDWPERGVYFFFHRTETHSRGDELRVTRVGTHAVSAGSGTTLWDRLRTHRGAKRGSYEGGGNHRGSVFRKRVGEAIIEREDLEAEYPNWGQGSSAGRDLRNAELALERRVSDYIRDLPFLWVAIPDDPGPESDRAYIERNAIALLSTLGSPSIDSWLGTHCPVSDIRQSGLWNIDHVGEEYDPDFLDTFAGYITGTSPID